MMGRYPYFRIKPSSADFDVVQHVMDFVDISSLADQNYLTLSGGEQQRVQLARVLAQVWDEPTSGKLLLLDEPVSALDIQYQHQVMRLVKEMAVKGFTVIIVLHDLNLALRYADKLLLLKNGRLAAYNEPSALTENTISEVFNIDTHIYRNINEYAFVSVKN